MSFKNIYYVSTKKHYSFHEKTTSVTLRPLTVLLVISVATNVKEILNEVSDFFEQNPEVPVSLQLCIWSYLKQETQNAPFNSFFQLVFIGQWLVNWRSKLQ